MRNNIQNGINKPILANTMSSLSKLIEVTLYDRIEVRLLLFCKLSFGSTAFEYLTGNPLENRPKEVMQILQVLSVYTIHETTNHISLPKSHYRLSLTPPINIEGRSRMRFRGVANGSVSHDLNQTRKHLLFTESGED